MTTPSDLALYRLDKAKENLKAARLLYDSGDFAGSVNRSYYAVFTAARALLALKGLDSKKHTGVIALFDKHYVKDGIISKEMGSILRTSKVLRENADYADYVEITGEAAGKELEKAAEFVKLIEGEI